MPELCLFKAMPDILIETQSGSEWQTS